MVKISDFAHKENDIVSTVDVIGLFTALNKEAATVRAHRNKK